MGIHLSSNNLENYNACPYTCPNYWLNYTGGLIKQVGHERENIYNTTQYEGLCIEICSEEAFKYI